MNEVVIEKKILVLVNKERRKHGLKPLYSDPTLKRAARSHSQDMMRERFVGHVNKRGEEPDNRVLKLEPKWMRVLKKVFGYDIGENICEVPIGVVEGYGRVSTPRQVARVAVKSWMNSPGHKELILDYEYTDTGSGVAYDKKRKAYLITQLFDKK